MLWVQIVTESPVILYLIDILNYVRIISLTVCVVPTMLKLVTTVFSKQDAIEK